MDGVPRCVLRRVNYNTPRNADLELFADRAIASKELSLAVQAIKCVLLMHNMRSANVRNWHLGLQGLPEPSVSGHHTLKKEFQ